VAPGGPKGDWGLLGATGSVLRDQWELLGMTGTQLGATGDHGTATGRILGRVTRSPRGSRPPQLAIAP